MFQACKIGKEGEKMKNKDTIKNMLQIELDKKRECWEVSNIGNDNICAIFRLRFGHKDKLWEGNWELALKYIDNL